MGIKKITRKQLKQDEFISGMNKFTYFMQENWKPFAFGLGAVLVICLLIVAWRAYTERTSARAMRLLDQGLEAFQGRVLSSGEEASVIPGERTFASEEEKYREEIQAFENVIDKYPNTGAGRTARYYLALSHLGNFKTEEGLEQLDGIIESSPDSLLGALALNTYAMVLEGQSRYEEAVKKYTTLLEQEGRYIPGDVILFKLGQCQLKLGNKAEAEKQLKRLSEDYPDSSYQFEAEKLLKEV